MRQLAIVVFLIAACGRPDGAATRATSSDRDSRAMRIESSAFSAGARIPPKYTCDGPGPSPPLAFGGVPRAAKALALTVEDPDAPSGTFTHWVVWNMPPQTAGVAEGGRPPGIEGKNDFGNNGWGGPCPPSGEHHYIFTLYALDAQVADRNGIAPHAIGKAQLVGTYRR